LRRRTARRRRPVHRRRRPEPRLRPPSPTRWTRMTPPTLLLLSFSPIDRDPRVMRQLRLFAPDYDVITCGYGPAPAEAHDHIEIPEQLKPWRASYKPTAVMQELHLHRRLYFGAPRTTYVLDAVRA